MLSLISPHYSELLEIQIIKDIFGKFKKESRKYHLNDLKRVRNFFYGFFNDVEIEEIVREVPVDFRSFSYRVDLKPIPAKPEYMEIELKFNVPDLSDSNKKYPLHIKLAIYEDAIAVMLFEIPRAVHFLKTEFEFEADEAENADERSLDQVIKSLEKSFKAFSKVL